MNEIVKFLNLTEQDVLAFSQGEHTVKVSKFKKIVNSIFQSSVPEALIKVLKEQGINGVDIYEPSVRGFQNYQWLLVGKECEALTVGSGEWQKGKVRIRVTLEFCPDEVEEKVEENSNNGSLDGLRKQLNLDS
ncbi:hypothetical protein H6G20_03660 [Desertifilum sp. FACHB-1129]|uniref:KGK domain-containing protein n=2 Tax=Desertifilum tharense IPPAS B-1220 TaxID=1781255 RepID=A0A1E5QKM1_9CYAN|nr:MULTISPECIES: KGK domain-containing protein [Desertifilum]MDA0209733.1 KGK domain-containing protein [Cyanobacteria bacterium FC1]MBD2310776.1 hypothetical protein [Desertifilum sp. FACHB-1129]MBD2320813.1 hypothetical protein [Desertifilum sp. FACHB-866]MBD2330941.1 hypothetical protein [Desertifilum sp. FACHB-868]OEJ75190.1 hypothetical protein BH720_10725 [Desertifilum tharense IPPAS B-1220]